MILVEVVLARGRLVGIADDIDAEWCLLWVVADAFVHMSKSDLALLPTLVRAMAPGRPDRIARAAADGCRHICHGRLVQRHIRIQWCRPWG